MITENNLRELPEYIMYKERRLNIIVRGKSPIWYGCVQRGHRKKWCHLDIQDEEEIEEKESLSSLLVDVVPEDEGGEEETIKKEGTSEKDTKEQWSCGIKESELSSRKRERK